MDSCATYTVESVEDRIKKIEEDEDDLKLEERLRLLRGGTKPNVAYDIDNTPRQSSKKNDVF